jgi:hypothetical protein
MCNGEVFTKMISVQLSGFDVLRIECDASYAAARTFTVCSKALSKTTGQMLVASIRAAGGSEVKTQTAGRYFQIERSE